MTPVIFCWTKPLMTWGSCLKCLSQKNSITEGNDYEFGQLNESQWIVKAVNLLKAGIRCWGRKLRRLILRHCPFKGTVEWNKKGISGERFSLLDGYQVFSANSVCIIGTKTIKLNLYEIGLFWLFLWFVVAEHLSKSSSRWVIMRKISILYCYMGTDNVWAVTMSNKVASTLRTSATMLYLSVFLFWQCTQNHVLPFMSEVPLHCTVQTY
jgi:hypothetical protein